MFFSTAYSNFRAEYRKLARDFEGMEALLWGQTPQLGVAGDRRNTGGTHYKIQM
jgi:hypothetical protein